MVVVGHNAEPKDLRVRFRGIGLRVGDECVTQLTGKQQEFSLGATASYEVVGTTAAECWSHRMPSVKRGERCGEDDENKPWLGFSGWDFREIFREIFGASCKLHLSASTVEEMALDKSVVLAEIDEVLAEAKVFSARTQDGLYGKHIPTSDASAAGSLLSAAIQRYSTVNSIHYKQMESAVQKFNASWQNHDSAIENLLGILVAIRADLEKGRMRSIQELMHAEMFGDYLEMAKHLLEEGYKDASAVLTGSTLEVHLKALAVKFGVPVTVEDAKGKTIHKKADTLSADLVKSNCYHSNDHKSVVAWLGTRNDAAHGDYHKYDVAKVDLLISSIRLFMQQHPA